MPVTALGSCGPKLFSSANSFLSACLKWHYAILTGYDRYIYVLQSNSIELFITLFFLKKHLASCIIKI